MVVGFRLNLSNAFAGQNEPVSMMKAVWSGLHIHKISF